MMELLLYIPTLKGGGAEKVFVNLANFLASQGNKVTLLTFDQGKYGHEVAGDVRLLVIKQPGKSYSPLGRMAACYKSLKKEVKTVQPEAVMSTLTEANVINWLVKRMNRLRYKLVVRQANVLEEGFFNKKRNIKDKWFDYMLKYAVRKADLVIANSVDTKLSVERYVERNQLPIVVIPNPVFSEDLLVKSAEATDFPFHENMPYILTVGSLRPEKDQLTLLKAFKIVASRHQTVKLLVIGEGQSRAGLESYCRENDLQSRVLMPGFMENPFPFYKHAHLFVLTSKSEGFGNVLVEALGFGLPVVSTRCNGGPPYILNDGEFGALVEVGDATALADKILEALRLPREQDNQKRMDRARYFSVENVGRMYNELLKKTI